MTISSIVDKPAFFVDADLIKVKTAYKVFQIASMIPGISCLTAFIRPYQIYKICENSGDKTKFWSIVWTVIKMFSEILCISWLVEGEKYILNKCLNILLEDNVPSPEGVELTSLT